MSAVDPPLREGLLQRRATTAAAAAAAAAQSATGSSTAATTSRAPPPLLSRTSTTASTAGVAQEDAYYNTNYTSPASFTYRCIRALFRLVLSVFYSSIIVEGVEHLPRDGTPCILASNHSNSLTDALILVVTVPSWKRRLLRLTAKDTQFGRGNFTSWLIASAGTLPIRRPKDHLGQKVDNSVVFEKLIAALARGDMVAMFPEGMSRYYPQLAPLRQGVARIVSDTLARETLAGETSFQIAVQTCSITYLHRNLFRSDVLVTFHPPIIVSAATHPGLAQTPVADETAIRALTTDISTSIRSGILDAPSWQVIRAAHTARRLYAPLGTKLPLGDHVRLTQRFVEGLGDEGRRAGKVWEEGESVSGVLKTPMVSIKEKKTADGGDYFANSNGTTSPVVSGSENDEAKSSSEDEMDVKELLRDLTIYQDLLTLHGVKDDRVRNPRLLRRRTLLKRILVRFLGSAALLLIALPGTIVFWAPVLYVTKTKSAKFAKKGPSWDTYDEVAQTKLVYGLITGVSLLFILSLLTGPLFPLSFLVILPTLFWLTLRWLEDLTSSLRALLALSRLLLLGKNQLALLRSMREGLRLRVQRLASERCGLPADGERWLVEQKKKEEKEARARARWLKRAASAGPLGALELGRKAAFFDPRRRRKKDWNESLRLHDMTDFPLDEEPVLKSAAAVTDLAQASGESGRNKGQR